jgi:hypothetical protein
MWVAARAKALTIASFRLLAMSSSWAWGKIRTLAFAPRHFDQRVLDRGENAGRCAHVVQVAFARFGLDRR